MHELPEELKMNVMVDLYKRVLKLSKFLRENLSDECLN